MWYADKSTVHFLDRAIDCRDLKLVFQFYELSQHETESLAYEFLDWIKEILTKDFVQSWKLNNRHVSENRVAEKVLSSIRESSGVSAVLNAALRSEIIDSSSTLRKIFTKFERKTDCPHGLNPLVSVDFPQYWQLLFADEQYDNETIKQKIMQLFQEENRKKTTVYNLPDVQGHIQILPYSHQKTLYYGSMSLSINAFFLGEHLEKAASSFASQLVVFSKLFYRMNGHVMLQPASLGRGESPYMNYFGSHRNSDGSHEGVGQKPNEYYYTYYLCGVEWANVISPRARFHLPNLRSDANQRENIAVKELNGGAVLLQSMKPIGSYNVSDALSLKGVVMNALYPGGTEISLRQLFTKSVDSCTLLSAPRNDWSIIPVLEEEIEIVGLSLVFRSANY